MINNANPLRNPLQMIQHYYELVRNPLYFDALGLSSMDCALSLSITVGQSPVLFTTLH